MVIIETTVFTRRIMGLLAEDEYREFQRALVQRPDLGKLIKGSGGLRKVRWGAESQGKRGGVRVIYFWAVKQEQLLLLLAYPKNERDDLSPEQLERLRSIIETQYS
jgi:hypothetical protein